MKKIISKNNIINLNILIYVIWELINLIIKCPAVILAINRIATVKGRIICLIISTKTIKWIRIKGVLLGINLEI
jgi:hypothetical protein